MMKSKSFYSSPDELKIETAGALNYNSNTTVDKKRRDNSDKKRHSFNFHDPLN